MKASIKGNINCKREDDLRPCTKTLDRFNVTHTIDGTNIIIDTFIKVTGWFDRGGLEHMLNRKMSQYGKCNIRVSDMIL